MNRAIMLLVLLMLTIIPFSYAANDFSYNRLYDGTQPIDGFNYSINVNHSIFSDNWITNIGTLSGVQDGQFTNIGNLLTIDSDYIDANWLALDGSNSPFVDIDWDGNSLFGLNDINGSGNIYMSRSSPGFNLINSMSTHPIGAAVIRANSDSGAFASLLSIGSQFPGAGAAANDSGIIAGGGRLIFVNNGLEDIAFAHVTGGGSNFSNASFSFRLRSDGDALLSGDLFLEDEEKSIRTVPIDGGSAIVFDSNDSIISGGFPVVEVARTAEGDRVITRWSQNGRNNSFSGAMNSFGPVPKSWVNFTGETDEEGINFLFNRSDYIKYCDYLQNNLSLIPEGCQYFADTEVRLVPLLFAGDLEVHRTATIHEGMTAYNDFDFIGRNGNDVNLLFNGALEDGQLHIRDKRQIEANITFFDAVITDFDDGTITPFVSTSITPEVGRDWDSVSDPQCHNDRCGNAKGGNQKIMQFSASTTFEDGTVASNNSRMYFWLSSSLNIGDSFDVTLDDNLGNVSTIYTTEVTLVDEFINVSFPQVFENKSNVTTKFILNGQNINRQVWVDIVRITSEPAEPIIINESYDGGRTIWGEDMGDLSCGIDVGKQINNDTLDTEWVMTVGSATCAVNIAGNVTFTDSTVTNQTVIGDQTVTGNLNLGGKIIFALGEMIDNLVDGWIRITGNLNVTGNTTSDFYFLGNGAYIGYNTTCQMIFYNSTGSVMSTQGCT